MAKPPRKKRKVSQAKDLRAGKAPAKEELRAQDKALQRTLSFQAWTQSLRLSSLKEEVTSLDPAAYDWSNLDDLGIAADAFQSAKTKVIPVTLVFCHPKALEQNPRRVIWYRGLALLSRKEVSDLVGVTLKKMEDDDPPGKLRAESARRLAHLLNRHICAVVAAEPNLSPEQVLEYVAVTFGATLQGRWQNEVGSVQSVFKGFIIKHFADRKLIATVVTPSGEMSPAAAFAKDAEISEMVLSNGTRITFGSNPDVGVYRELRGEDKRVVDIEVKGGTDAANVYERLGKAADSFRRSREANPRCRNIYVADRITPAIEKLIETNPEYAQLVNSYYLLSGVLTEQEVRKRFLKELDELAGVTD